MPNVTYVFPTSHRFRVPFHDLLRAKLAARGVTYHYIYSRDDNLGKGDTADIPWATAVPSRGLNLFGHRLVYQQAYQLCRGADLVLLQQQNNLLLNYPLQIARRLSGQRIGFVGHGRNLQSTNPDGAKEQFKRMWSRRADWWFAYTERCGRAIESLGFPPDRITVFNNAADVTSMKSDRASITEREVGALRERHFAGSRNVAIYIGGLYREKRIDFLLAAAERIRAQVPDFHLAVIGGGPHARAVKLTESLMPWVHFIGPTFGRDKALYAAAARVLLMPGLVGLGVLDAFAFRLPVVATDYPYHSPEIDYLAHGRNGLMVRPYTSVAAYAEAVVALLANRRMCDRLVDGATDAANTFTVEAMATRFADGVIGALDAPPAKHSRARWRS